MESPEDKPKGLLLLIAGIKGAIGSTLAIAVQALQHDPESVLPYLMTAQKLAFLGDPGQIKLAGWDRSDTPLEAAVGQHHVLNGVDWEIYAEALAQIPIQRSPDSGSALPEQVQQLKTQFQAFLATYPDHFVVFVNLLPAGPCHDLARCATLDDVLDQGSGFEVPDLAYVIAAIESGVPVVNFTPNEVEIPAVVQQARLKGVPLAGRDGKTGQTYLKVVLASALRARKLLVNGWYSVNILGNADGENLMDPNHAACKLTNKTGVLDQVLGYTPGQRRYGASTHKVAIDFYAPRGDAKEAWDVIDFEGVFGLGMSLRLNLQGRDSILAVPLVLDLARWMAAADRVKRSGPVPELAFYFKQGIENHGPETFEDQLAALDKLEKDVS